MFCSFIWTPLGEILLTISLIMMSALLSMWLVNLALPVRVPDYSVEPVPNTSWLYVIVTLLIVGAIVTGCFGLGFLVVDSTLYEVCLTAAFQ